MWPHAGAGKNGIRQDRQMNCKAVENAADFTLVARRNNSLSSGDRFLVICSLAVVTISKSRADTRDELTDWVSSVPQWRAG